MELFNYILRLNRKDYFKDLEKFHLKYL